MPSGSLHGLLCGVSYLASCCSGSPDYVTLFSSLFFFKHQKVSLDFFKFIYILSRQSTYYPFRDAGGLERPWAGVTCVRAPADRLAARAPSGLPVSWPGEQDPCTGPPGRLAEAGLLLCPPGPAAAAAAACPRAEV